MVNRSFLLTRRMSLLATIWVTGVSGLPLIANAQESGRDLARLEEIVVTAQRREQSLQDVPIAVTAMNQDFLRLNRVETVVDIGNLAPGMVGRTSAGATQLASFTMRGVTSYGTVLGSDRQIPVYLDGVYLGGSDGSIFDLPDVSRIEVLRGPQGTLFGRNATAGAISITTREPSGELGVVQELTAGNLGRLRSRTTIDSPQLGPLSLLATYVRDDRRGSVRNLGGGAVWDRSEYGRGSVRVRDHLGNKDSESLFVAARLDPTDDLSLTYKFDYLDMMSTPNAVATVGVYPQGGSAGGLLQALLPMQPEPVLLFPDARRPDAVNNEFSWPINQVNKGHSLTAVWDMDTITLKSITGYRESSLNGATELTGLGGLINVIPQLGPVGEPFCVICQRRGSANSTEMSTELQMNYQSDQVTLTAGAVYYSLTARKRGPLEGPGDLNFVVLPDYVIPAQGLGIYEYFEGSSAAAYTQVEYHLTPEVDLVGGYRLTRDDKKGWIERLGEPRPSDASYSFKETNPSYLVGVNYAPTEDVLLWAKYSTAFMSGGSVTGVPYEPEEAFSWEAGIKADFLNNRLRTNFNVFHVTYENLQTSDSGINIGRPDLSTVILNIDGDSVARGFEFEGSALLAEALTVNASLGYTDAYYKGLDEDFVAWRTGGIPGSEYLPTLIPKWTSNLSAQYTSAPLFGDGNAHLAFNVSANWRSKLRMMSNPAQAVAIPAFAPLEFSPARWIVNARLALRDIDLGPAQGEVAVWGRNLTDSDNAAFGLIISNVVASATFEEARTYGVDFMIRF